MGRKYAVIIGSVLMSCLLSMTVYAGTQDKLAISQVNAEMPEVRVYLNQNIVEEKAQEAKAYLGEKSLSFISCGKACEEGILYYVLLDCSASVPDAYFADIKKGIQSFTEYNYRR